jgi:hypothetical protein
MNHTKKLIGIVAVSFASLIAGLTSRAQEAATTPASSGLLGKRYVEAGFSFIDVNHTGTDVYGTGVNANLPITSNIDLGVSYDYGWVEGHSSFDSHLLDVAATTYFAQGAFKPFGSVSLGYNWVDGYNRSVWGVAGGVEFEVNSKVSVTGSVGYDDDFKKGDNSSWNGAVSGHYWLTKDIAASATIALIEGGDVGYGVSVLWKF